MSIQLKKVSEQVKRFSENLVYNGLNLVTDDIIREIELYLQNASQLNLFRLATSLRYLHIELKRFLDSSPAFNIDRYVFFLSNCWLQSFAFINYAQNEKKDKKLYNNLMGVPSNTKIISKLILQLIGIEKVLLEGVMMGLVFYFVSLYGKTRGSVLKWNLMSTYQKGVKLDFFLQQILPNSEPTNTVAILLTNYIELEDIPWAIDENNIYFEKESNSKIFVGEKTEEIFSILKIENFYLNSKSLLEKLKRDYEITPFDPPANYFDYLYIKQVKIAEYYKEGENEIKTPVYVYKINHEKEYPLFIRIPDKPVNQSLISKFKNLADKKKLIQGIFCKLILERGQLGIFPLSLVQNNKLKYPNISEELSLNERDFLNRIYKIKK